MEFTQHFLGGQSAWFHLWGLLICLIGTLLVKYHYYRKHRAVCEAKNHNHSFSPKKWFNENIIEVIFCLIASFIVVRFADILIHWANQKYSLEIPVTEDQIFYYLAAAVLIQWQVHIRYRRK